MASTGMFVLIIWVNDDPIQGNVVKVTNIAEPRKAFNEYSVGETVKSKCPGFPGVHSGVIAKIGSLEEKKQLEDSLKGDQFNQLVKKYVKKDKEKRTEKIPDKTSSKTSVVEKPAVPAKKRKTQQEKSAPKPVQKNLETVARELEVTELHQQLEENRYLPISQVVRESMDILVSDCRPGTPERDVCIDCTVLQEQVQSNTNQICGLQNQLQSFNSQLLSTKSQLQSSQNLNQSLQHQLSNLEYYVQIMWSKNQGWHNSSCNEPGTSNRGESSYQQNSNNNQQISTTQSSTTQSSTTQSSTTRLSSTQSTDHQLSSISNQQTSSNSIALATSHNETLDISIPDGTTPIESANSSFIQDTAASSTVAFYNNYTQEILEAKVSKLKNYSKCAKVLLRLLYSDQERQGRSISGVAANSKYEAKPALQHPNRIQVIYEVIHWKLMTKPVFFGHDVDLECIIKTEDTSEPMAWIRIPNGETIAYNTIPTDDTKYEIGVQYDDTKMVYNLTIKQFNSSDVNRVYRCDFGFFSYADKLLLNDRDFISRPSNTDVKSKFTLAEETLIGSVKIENCFPRPRCTCIFQDMNISEFMTIRYTNASIFFNTNIEIKYSTDICGGSVNVTCTYGDNYLHFNELVGDCSEKSNSKLTVVLLIVGILSVALGVLVGLIKMRRRLPCWLRSHLYASYDRGEVEVETRDGHSEEIESLSVFDTVPTRIDSGIGLSTTAFNVDHVRKMETATELEEKVYSNEYC